MEYPGWTVETTHPVEQGAEGYCQTCHDMIQPTIDMAVAWGSPAHGNQITDAQGVNHNVVVRQVE